MESKPIVKNILVLASPERVWAALTDVDQRSIWFGADLGSSPFADGAHVAGRIAPTQVLPSMARRRRPYAGLPLELDLVRVEPPRLLSFWWSPLAFFHPDIPDVPAGMVAARSLVSVEIEPDPRGARLTVTERLDGFPEELLERAAAVTANGWTTQLLLLDLFLNGALDRRLVKD